MRQIDTAKIGSEFEKFKPYADDFMGFTYFEIQMDEFLEKLKFIQKNEEWHDHYIFGIGEKISKLDENSKGRFFAVYAGEELACLMDFYPLDGNIYLNYELPYEESLEKSLDFRDIIIKPKFRGNSLQKKSLIVLEYISLQDGYKHAFCRSPLSNYFSISNIVDSGFSVIDIINSESNDIKNAAYLCHLPLGRVRAKVPEQYAVRNSSFDELKNVLELGFCGFKTIHYYDIDDYFLSFSIMYYD